MKLLQAIAIPLFLLSSAALAQVSDSTGQNVGTDIGYGDTIYSSTWNRISGKPATATRWPSWAEVSGKPSTFPTTWSQVTGKPSSFPPASHNHDDRYLRKGTSGAISGNLDVSGRVKGSQVITGDVGGDRWCRANTSGRIQCTHSAPSGGGAGKDIVAGWPLILRCGVSDRNGELYFLTATSYRTCDFKMNCTSRVRYQTLATEGIGTGMIEFNTDGSYSRDTGANPYSGCRNKHINEIPSSRKIL